MVNEEKWSLTEGSLRQKITGHDSEIWRFDTGFYDFGIGNSEKTRRSEFVEFGFHPRFPSMRYVLAMVLLRVVEPVTRGGNEHGRDGKRREREVLKNEFIWSLEGFSPPIGSSLLVRSTPIESKEPVTKGGDEQGQRTRRHPSISWS